VYAWAEASANEQIRKTLLEVAKVWGSALNEPAAIHHRVNELEVQLGAGCSESSGRL
jgi:hypothetical protein